MTHYHNSPHLPSTTTQATKAQSQSHVILAFLKENAGVKYTAWQLFDMLAKASNAPLVISVMRSLSDLTKAGLIHHDLTLKPERHGSPNTTWFVAKET